MGSCRCKIDFFDRDDNLIIREYENLAKACADRKLLVDFHGCSKPTGLHRAYRIY
ncbi:MAG: glycoside hydrolase family 97 catalytic domain-containing protein [Barnesiella sp.]